MKMNCFWKSILAGVSEKLSLPASIVPGTCEIYLCGRRTLYINTHNGIIRADEDCVSLKCDEFTLTILGSGLLIDAATAHSAYVRGRFSQICFD